MSPEDDAVKPAGEFDFEVLMSKHPEQQATDQGDFMHYDTVPN